MAVAVHPHHYILPGISYKARQARNTILPTAFALASIRSTIAICLDGSSKPVYAAPRWSYSTGMLRTYLFGLGCDLGIIKVARLPASNIRNKIQDIFSLTSFDSESLSDAKLAVEQALHFVETNHIELLPNIDMAEDGIISLEWISAQSSTLLVFSGDGTASYSHKKDGGFYSGGISEFILSEAAPPELLANLCKSELVKA
jgi:hypothetical protein